MNTTFIKKNINTNFIVMRDRYKKTCVFCHPEEFLILKKTKNFNVIADLNPITPGHVLICSKNHFSCAGEIEIKLFAELEELKESVQEQFSTPFACFEHGRAGSCLAYPAQESCCHHFHLHIFPCNKNISPLLKQRFIEIPIEKFYQTKQHYENFGEYLYVENNGSKYFYPISEPIESHLLRTYFSNAIGNTHLANWAKIDTPYYLKTSLTWLKNIF